MRVTSKFLMATTALALMVGYGAYAADEAAKKTAPKKVVSKVIDTPPAPVQPPIMPPVNGQMPMDSMGQMGGMPMGQPPSMPGSVPSGMGMMPMPEGISFYYGKPMHEMQENMMRVRPSGDADFDFVQAMLPHHRGAIDMARIVLEKGKDPEIKKLATEILKAQEAEMKLMSDWIGKQQNKKSETN